MRVLIFVINYKADNYLIQFIQSVFDAKENYQDTKIEINIHVIDNSLKTDEEFGKLKSNVNKFGRLVTLHNNATNDGYFGGLKFAQSLTNDSYDYVIYCNPDIMLKYDFLKKLKDLDTFNAGMIAPSIIANQTNYNQNPKYINRLSKNKLKFLQLIYSNIIFFSLYGALSSLKNKIIGLKHKNTTEIQKDFKKIYAPHGSIFIFSDIQFFKKLPLYPCFLFGEELFIAEEALISGIDIIYIPTLEVTDTRHASIKLIKNNSKRLFYHKSIQYILHNYF